MALTDDQKARVLGLLHEYLNAPPDEDGITPVEANAELDRRRLALIEKNLMPLITSYLAGSTPLIDFKSEIDGLNKRNSFWGFKGIKGQMFFNMVVNVADDQEECDQEIKSAITLPKNEQLAASRIKTFVSYVKRLGEQWIEAGNTGYGTPKPNSIPFFLSWFWQVQAPDVWPVYYTTGVNALNDLNLWQPSGDLADDYIAFKEIHLELQKLFSSETRTKNTLYDVEHVLWFMSGHPFDYKKDDNGDDPTNKPRKGKKPEVEDTGDRFLPNSYVPPIVSILPRMALNEESLQEAAKRSGTNLYRAFEKHIDATFTILGYDTRLLGQGSGRVPDGIARAYDESYAILWDAKVRADGYSMGTDDRTIREYVQTQSRQLKRRGFLRNIYYAIVSSSFADDYDDLIRSLKMETDVNEVILLEASALVAMVDVKLRAPLIVTLGPDGLQRLFSTSGVLDVETVKGQLN